MPDDPFADIGDLFESGDNRNANRAYARASAARRGIDPDFADRLMTRESGFNPKAFNKETGAAGIGQMIPGTAKRFGLQNPHDAKESIDKSLDYLAELHRKFGGDTRRMAAGYFAGEGQSDRALANPKGNPKTQAYANAVGGTGRAAPKPTAKAPDPFGDISDLFEGSAPASAPKSFMPQARPTASTPHLKLAMSHLTDESGQVKGPASALIASKLTEEAGTRRQEAKVARAAQARAQATQPRPQASPTMPYRGRQLAQDEADITPEQAQQIVSGEKTGAEIRAKNRPKPAYKPGFFEQAHYPATGIPYIDVPLTKLAQGIIGGGGKVAEAAGQMIDDPASIADLLTMETLRKPLDKQLNKLGVRTPAPISDVLRGHPLSTTEKAVAPTNPVYQAGSAVEEASNVGAENEDTFLKRLPRMAGGFAPVVASGPAAPVVMAMQSRADQYRDALAHDATQQQASDAATQGTILGGVAGMIPGGAAARVPQGIAKTLGREALLGGVLGAGQTYGANKIANQGAGYDPQRSSLEGVPQAALEQAALGPMMALPHAFGSRPRPNAEPRVPVEPAARPEWLPEGPASGEGLPLGAQYPAEGLQRGSIINKIERKQPLSNQERASIQAKSDQKRVDTIQRKIADGKPLTKVEQRFIEEQSKPPVPELTRDPVIAPGNLTRNIGREYPVPAEPERVTTQRTSPRVKPEPIVDTAPVVADKTADKTRAADSIPAADIPTEAGARPVEPQPPVTPDQRKPENAARREAIDALVKKVEAGEGTPQEVHYYTELHTSEKTDLPNGRAYTKAPKRAVQVRSDMDGLKWVNDTYGHESGDKLLRAQADALRDEGIESYHVSGDEFNHQFDTPEEASAAMERVRDRVKRAIIEVELPDGSIKHIQGAAFSYGVGERGSAAEAAMGASKRDRLARGERSERGERPPNLIESVPEGQPDQVSNVTPKRPPKEVAPEPTKPTEPQASTSESSDSMKGLSDVEWKARARDLADADQARQSPEYRAAFDELSKAKQETIKRRTTPPKTSSKADQAKWDAGVREATDRELELNQKVRKLYTPKEPLPASESGGKLSPDVGREGTKETGIAAAAEATRSSGSDEAAARGRVQGTISAATRDVTRTVLDRADSEIPGLREKIEKRLTKDGKTPTPEQTALQVGGHLKTLELSSAGTKLPKAHHKKFGNIELVAKTPDGAKILLGAVDPDGKGVTYHMAQNPEHELLSNSHLTAKPEDIAKLPTVSWNELGTLGDAHPPTAVIEAMGKKLNLPAREGRAPSKEWRRLSDIPDDVAIEHFPEVFRNRVKQDVSEPQWADMALNQMDSKPKPNEPKIITDWRKDVREGGLGANRVDLIAKGMTVAAYDTYRDLKTFSAWSQKMVKDWGEKIKPKLTSIWEAATNGSRKAQERVKGWVKTFMDPKRPGQEGFIRIGGEKTKDTPITTDDLADLVDKYTSRQGRHKSDEQARIETINDFLHSADPQDRAAAERYVAQASQLFTEVQAKMGDAPFDQKSLKEHLLTSQSLMDGEPEKAWPIPVYVGAKGDPNTVGLLLDKGGKLKMFEGNDEATPKTLDLVDELMGVGDKQVEVWTSQPADVIERIKKGDFPEGIFVSPNREHAAGYWGEGRDLVKVKIPLSRVSQHSEVDWQVRPPKKTSLQKFMDPKRPGQEGFISVGGVPSTRVKPTPNAPKPNAKPTSTPTTVAGKDFGGMDWVRSRLSNLDFVGSYERRGGTLGRQASDLMRQAQVDIETGRQTQQQALPQLRKDMAPVIKQLDANGLPGLAEQMKRHLDQVSGKPEPFQKTAGLLKSIQYNMRLRYNPKSMIINMLQPLTTLWPHVSSIEFARLTAQAHSPAVRKRLAPILGGGATKIGSAPTKSRIPDPFAKVSEANKVMGYLHGEKEAKRLGLTGQAAERMAMDWAKKIEFDNSKWDAPPIMAGPVASTLLQFKGFTVKNIESITNDLKRHQGDKLGGHAARAGKRIISQLAMGGARSFPGVKQIGGIVVVGAIAKALSKTGMDEETANKTAEAVYYGAPALAGEDLSGSLMLIDPPYGDTIYEQLINFGAGPTVSAAARMVQEGKRAYNAHEAGDDDKAIAAGKRAVGALTPYPKMVESAIGAGKQLAGGEAVKVKAGDKEEELNKFEATMKALGFTPTKQTKGYDEKDAYDWQKALVGRSTTSPSSAPRAGRSDRSRGARR
jgi:GGDEF domain-containing protein